MGARDAEGTRQKKCNSITWPDAQTICLRVGPKTVATLLVDWIRLMMSGEVLVSLGHCCWSWSKSWSYGVVREALTGLECLLIALVVLK